MNTTPPGAGSKGDRTPSSNGKVLRSRVTATLGVIIAVIIFVWLGRGVAENWDELSPHLARVSTAVIVIAAFVFVLFTSFMSLAYYHCLRLAGAAVGIVAAMSVYMASQLGKYLPGKLFYVAGQIGLATWLRISVTQSVLGFTAAQVVITATGVLIASPLLGIVMGRGPAIAVILAAGGGFIALTSGVWVKPFNALQRKRNKPELQAFSPLRALQALVSACAGWVCYACFAAILGAAVMSEWTPIDLTRVGTAAVAAWLVGFLSFITPAGMGVREGAFVLLTRGIMTEPTAMALALMMRLLYTVFQLPIGALALAYSVRRRPPSD